MRSNSALRQQLTRSLGSLAPSMGTHNVCLCQAEGYRNGGSQSVPRPNGLLRSLRVVVIGGIHWLTQLHFVPNLHLTAFHNQSIQFRSDATTNTTCLGENKANAELIEKWTATNIFLVQQSCTPSVISQFNSRCHRGLSLGLIAAILSSSMLVQKRYCISRTN